MFSFPEVVVGKDVSIPLSKFSLRCCLTSSCFKSQDSPDAAWQGVPMAKRPQSALPLCCAIGMTVTTRLLSWRWQRRTYSPLHRQFSISCSLSCSTLKTSYHFYTHHFTNRKNNYNLPSTAVIILDGTIWRGGGVIYSGGSFIPLTLGTKNVTLTQTY